MSKRSQRARWQGHREPLSASDWLKILALAGLLLSVGWLGFFMPGTSANGDLPDVVIRRVMTSNPQVCYPVEGEYYDWIELQNISDHPVDLRGFKLTDTGDLRDALVLDEHALAPNDTLILYCDDRPEGYAGDALFTGFKLPSDGKLLMLADPAQRVNAVNVPPMRKGFVYLRDPETGEYAVRAYGEMSDSEKAERAQAEGFDPNDLMISEIMPMNRSILADEDGDFSDWIEIYNPKSDPVNLEGWALTDDDVKRAKWLFPARIIKPGEYLIVFADRKDRRDPAGQLHANFRLSAQGETIRLSNPEGEVVSQLSYDQAEADRSLCRLMDGSVANDRSPSPGGKNLEPGQQGDYSRLMDNAAGLYINEIYYGSQDVDWVEIYNGSGRGLDLSGAGLSDNPSKPRKWQFPDGATIPANGYLVVTLEGSLEKQAQRLSEGKAASVRGDYSADFGLTAGETLCLSTSKGKLVDRVMLTTAYDSASLGRAQGYDTLRYFGEMTPGQPNAQKSYGAVGREVTLDPAPGVIHDERIQLTMTAEPGVDIYYTTDGSDPTADSRIYSGPITIDKNTRIKAIADPRDVLDPQLKTASYIFGPHTLRLVHVTGRKKDLNGSDASLNTGVKGTGCTVYVEMYEPDGTQIISQSCHYILTGHQSRTHNSQKSFRLNAQRALGDTRLRARLFDNRDFEAVKAVTLRASGQDYKSTHMLDSILTSLAEGTHVVYQETEVCVVYVNNQYWGLYNMREHVDSHSICQWEGWTDHDNVTIIHGDGPDARAVSGSSTPYKAFWQWLKSADLTRASDMEKMREQFCIESYLDYVIIEMFVNNTDLGNIRCYRSETEDPRWHYILFDLDISFRNRSDLGNNIKGWFDEKVGKTTPQYTLPFRKLMQNDQVRDYFLTRFGELLSTNLSSRNIVAKIEARRDLIKDEMVYNCKRWKWKYTDWEKNVDRIISYAQSRPANVIGYLQESFKLSDADVQHYFGDAMALASRNGE